MSYMNDSLIQLFDLAELNFKHADIILSRIPGNIVCAPIKYKHLIF